MARRIWGGKGARGIRNAERVSGTFSRLLTVSHAVPIGFIGNAAVTWWQHACSTTSIAALFAAFR
jgi:hypothetical protein